MFGLPTDTWTRLLIWLIVGLAIYFLYAKAHSRVGAKPGS
jgi:basic amino acid/polyamine antiporter, APA family